MVELIDPESAQRGAVVPKCLQVQRRALALWMDARGGGVGGVSCDVLLHRANKGDSFFLIDAPCEGITLRFYT